MEQFRRKLLCFGESHGSASENGQLEHKCALPSFWTGSKNMCKVMKSLCYWLRLLKPRILRKAESPSEHNWGGSCTFEENWGLTDLPRSTPTPAEIKKTRKGPGLVRDPPQSLMPPLAWNAPNIFSKCTIQDWSLPHTSVSTHNTVHITFSGTPHLLPWHIQIIRSK